MVSKKYRVITAAILAFASLGAFNSFANGSELSDGGFLLGNPCLGSNETYTSRSIAIDTTTEEKIAGICYPSQNIPTTFIWTEDQNSTPSYKYPKGKVAFGRLIDENKCTPNENLEPFLRDFPDTKCDLEKKVWWSDTYTIKIIVADFDHR